MMLAQKIALSVFEYSGNTAPEEVCHTCVAVNTIGVRDTGKIGGLKSMLMPIP